MGKHKIGIVTVLYNSEMVLEDFFQTLNEQTYKNFILYLVDNKSTDNSVSKGKELEQNINFECRWLIQEKNLGVAEGNNIGIRSALADTCDYILLSNNDIVLQKETLENLLTGLQTTHATMAVPKIYYWDNPQKIWTAGGGFQWLQFSTYHRGENEYDTKQYDEKVEIEYAPTCFMLIEASVFQRVGLMNKRYFVYYDDTDFIWRAVKLGKEKLMYIPDATLQHKVSSCTGGNMSNFSIRYSTRNHLFFALKYCHSLHFLLFILYLIIHFGVRKVFMYNKEQLLLILKSYKEGFNLYREEKQLTTKNDN